MSDKRPQFQQMLKDAAHNRWAYVLCWKVDRFARNRYDSAVYKFRLKKFGVRVIYAGLSLFKGMAIRIVLDFLNHFQVDFIWRGFRNSAPHTVIAVSHFFSGNSMCVKIFWRNVDIPIKPCVIYARYSSHAQKDASIEQQVRDCEAYAKANNLRVLKVYAETKGHGAIIHLALQRIVAHPPLDILGEVRRV